MDHRNAFAPPKSRVDDTASGTPATPGRHRWAAPAVLALAALLAVLTRRHLVAAWQLADAGALPPLVFLAMALADTLLVAGAVLGSLRWRGARPASLLAALCAAGAWMGLPHAIAAGGPPPISFGSACDLWLMLAAVGAQVASAQVHERRLLRAAAATGSRVDDRNGQRP